MNTCCGTHVSNLSELQMIKFVGTEPKKGMVRVSFLAGNRVLLASAPQSTKAHIADFLARTPVVTSRIDLGRA